MSNWLSALIWPISPVLAMWWFSPLTVTRALGCFERHTVGCRVHRVDAERLRLLDHVLVEVERGVGRFHRVRRRPVRSVLGLEGLDERRVLGAVDALEVVPGGVLTGEIDAHRRSLFLGDRHRDDRRVVGAEAGLVVGLDEADVGRAVDGVEHEVGLAPRRSWRPASSSRRCRAARTPHRRSRCRAPPRTA